MLQTMMTMDGNFLVWIQEHIRNVWLTPFFMFVTTLGNGGFIWIAISLGLLVNRKTRKIGALSLIALAGSVLIDNVILKNVIARVRPYEVIPGLTSLIGAQTDYSFPSGQTGSSFASAVVLFCGLPKKYGVPALVLAALIGVSRLYVGVHYLSDVIGGAVIGTGIALITYWIGIQYIEWKVRERCL